jgi:dUTP pyrophosphatase
MSDQIQFVKISEHAVLPSRGSNSSAALDIHSCEEVIIPARKFATIKTGLKLAIPEGYYGRVAPRSGLAAKFGIDTLAGVVDSDYRGELGCVLMNNGDQDFKIEIGDRIAQLIIEKIITPEAVWVDQLPDTERGEGGFGSTGV